MDTDPLAAPADPPGRWRALVIIDMGMLLAFAPRFSSAAVAPLLAAEWHTSGLQLPLLTASGPSMTPSEVAVHQPSMPFSACRRCEMRRDFWSGTDGSSRGLGAATASIDIHRDPGS